MSVLEASDSNIPSTVTTASEPLHLEVGAYLQLQAVSPADGSRMRVQVIGYLPERSVIVRLPSRDGRVPIVREGRRFAVRMLSGNSVQGFVTTVLHCSLKPYPHLHLSYPDDFERKVIRNAQRVSAEIPVSLLDLDNPGDGKAGPTAALIDLSTSGARISSEHPIAAVGATVRIEFDIEVAGAMESITLVGTVRNSGAFANAERDSSLNYAGLEFNEVERLQQVLLHSWVLERRLADR